MTGENARNSQQADDISESTNLANWHPEKVKELRMRFDGLVMDDAFDFHYRT